MTRRSLVSVVPVVLVVLVAALLGGGYLLYKRSSAHTNDVALSSEPKPVTSIVAQKSSYEPTRRYIATIAPWLSAKVGPQLVSAYVDTVLLRPGAVVKKGDVMATLDCRDASAAAQSVAMAARALETKQAAAAKEAARIQGMLDGGFVSANEAEKKLAESAAQQADILAAKAKLVGSSLEVNDCILKAPFDGEVDMRMVDPGAFVRPGTPLLTLVDRSTVRVVADVPETDFEFVAPGKSVKLRLIANGDAMTATISRRSPAADPATRTVQVEIDLADPQRQIPVGTTAEVVLEVGAPRGAAEIPLIAAAVRGDKATVFVVETKDGVAVAKKRTIVVLGESGSSLFVEESLIGAVLVTEGRGTLSDGDRVNAKLAPTPAPSVTP